MFQYIPAFSLSLLLFCYAAPANAIEQIPVPKELPPHPRLFMSQDEIDQFKVWAETEAWVKKRVEGFINSGIQDAGRDFAPDRSSNGNIARKAKSLAFAYALSGEEKLAEKTAEILLYYADKYPTYSTTGSKGRATSSTLGEAPFAIDLATAYDFIYNSGALSEDDKSRIEDDFFRPCAEVLRICNHRTKSNWRSWAFAGLGVVGFCIGEPEYIEEALNGYRDRSGNVVRYGFAQQVAEAVLADGIFWERSLGYHFYTLSALVQLAEAAKHCGVDLWHTEITGNEWDAGSDMDRRWGPTGKKTIKPMFDAPFYYIFPNLTGAAVADSHTFHLSSNMSYEMAYHAYKDEKYAWLLNRVEPRHPRYDIGLMWFNPHVTQGKFDLSEDAQFGLNGVHKNTCTLFPSAGYAILRENATRNATCVLMTFGRYGTGHDHPDKLHISVYGKGKIAAPDAGSLGYDNPEHLTWANQTIAHNTVTVDEVAQYPQGNKDSIWASDGGEKISVGRLIFFHPGDHLKAARADCDNAYEGVTLDRTVALVDSRLFDIYRVRGRDKHQYDWSLNVDGELSDSSLELESQSELLSTNRGYDHIINVQRGPMTQENFSITYAISDEDSLRITVLPVSGGEVILGSGLKEKDTRKPIFIVRSNATNVDFVSMMALDSSAKSGIRKIAGMPEGVIGLEIERTDGGRDYLVSAEKSRKISIAGTAVEGQLALIRVDKDGAVMNIETIK